MQAAKGDASRDRAWMPITAWGRPGSWARATATSGDFYREKATHNPGERLALALAPEIAVTLDVLAG